ncbi:lipid IV(A) 3-deoxy-D-manno-octulosonic acid transferase [Pseudochrobactrum kiredjianiae]|uniref:3-deoxy-D-manno-octulosonic acid transferase n=1 Tax=Pseudochrobactrum kiredjianiae TaxID=386305 RepID=A0ABW3V787_9HYPH|nr:lipid IV(A) 3-deoxy-D-manno-octulosonic acid transferase [Pseudochrobactrum kiredjianiae]MDM7850297.1 lipid IV(A) 3-deoxy-D-manno-octulosonic acid transferase [Pseudochrobactrum kiredjianiae]
MSEKWARTVLKIYKAAGCAAYPLIGPYISYRVSKGKEDRSRRSERYGRSPIARPEGPLVWMHAASVGEFIAILPLVEHFLGQDIRILLTTGTRTSAALVAERLGDRVIHQYVPLDLLPAVRRFLDHWQPDVAIKCESEIWPMTILELGKRHIPQILINGRMSDRSYAKWKKRSSVAEALFENFAHVVAQSDADGERFRQLGARPVTISGNLKVDTDAPPVDTQELARLQQQIGKRKVWAAISTHDGEEEIAANVHTMLSTRHPDLLTMIVPRHPDRANAIRAMIEAKGLVVAQRSRNEDITPQTAVYLGDTIGEMGLYLRLSQIAFVGKSLTGEGGQNPLEPAMLGTAVLSGRNVQNFRESYQRLIKNGGAKLVSDHNMLAGAVNFLFNNPEKLEAMTEAGKRTVGDMRGALERTLTALEPFIRPLAVKSRLYATVSEGASETDTPEQP